MKAMKLSFAWIFMLATLFVISCSEDIELQDQEDLVDDALVAEARGGRGNGGGGDGRGNGRGEDTRVIEDWIQLFLEVDRYAEGMRPNATARALAYIHLAGYEVYAPSSDRLRSHSDILDGLNPIVPGSSDINYHIALNQAYHMTMDHFIINLPQEQEVRIDEQFEQTQSRINVDLPQSTLDNSLNWGAAVAREIIRYAQTDEAAETQILDPQPTSYIPPTGDGYWTFSAEPERALFPYWSEVRTFIIAPEETTSIAPIGYSTDPASSYYQQMMDVYEANNQAREEDGEQLWIAEFWSDDVTGLMFSPPARQFSIAGQLIDRERMSMSQALQLNVKLGFSLNDAAVSTWKYKYDYMVMRPSVYIQDLIDPTYQTNLYRLIPWPNPTFPGYPSGHSAFASAAAGVFIDFFGNRTNFTDRSHEGRTEFRGEPRRFRSFQELAAENAYSRIPLGVHIEMDCTEGLRLGYEIADAVNNHDLTN